MPVIFDILSRLPSTKLSGIMTTSKIAEKVAIVSRFFVVDCELTDIEAIDIKKIIENEPASSVFHNRHEFIEQLHLKDLQFAIASFPSPGIRDNAGSIFSDAVEIVTGKKCLARSGYLAFFHEKPLDKYMDFLNSSLTESFELISTEDLCYPDLLKHCLFAVETQTKNETLAKEVDLNVSDDELIKIIEFGIQNPDGSRNGGLKLPLVFLKTIANYYKDQEKRNPTDIELETFAQTWSEHCKHIIFSSPLDEDIKEGIYSQYIKNSSQEARKSREYDGCASLFSDNAGAFKSNNNTIISLKAETHNSPSSLDPFGGAETGLLGVHRDIIGFGMGSLPAAGFYFFCLPDPRKEHKLFRDANLSIQALDADTIASGIVKGVGAAGNCSGVPTILGGVFFHESFSAKPLVYCGCLGVAPEKLPNNVPVTRNEAPAGAMIITIGGRTGRDGIHGATFSSAALDDKFNGSVVQIGDPFTQKKMSDMIIKRARDKSMYEAITDCGAGGFSSAIGEMAAIPGGFEVELEKAPLKSPNMLPWEIWISESQERMILAIMPNKVDQFIDLAKSEDVEATVIGKFTDSGRGIIKYDNTVVADINLRFLHEGNPKIPLTSEEPQIASYTGKKQVEYTLSDTLLSLLGSKNISSRRIIIEQYDSEVQGRSVMKQLQGKGKVCGDVAAFLPNLHYDDYAIAVSQGIFPRYSYGSGKPDVDTYNMAACSISFAVGSLIAAGCETESAYLMDNFCWCDSTNPKRLWQLKRAAEACSDFSISLKTPFISGKDSMFNDFHGFDEDGNPVKFSSSPTLLITAATSVKTKSLISCDIKCSGDLLYIIGITSADILDSEYAAEINNSMLGFGGPIAKREDIVSNFKAFSNISKDFSIASSACIGYGGLGICLAKKAHGGQKGFSIYLDRVPTNGNLSLEELLFSETPGRIICSINPKIFREFEKTMSKKNVPFANIGTVSKDNYLVFNKDKKEIIRVNLDQISQAYETQLFSFE